MLELSYQLHNELKGICFSAVAANLFNYFSYIRIYPNFEQIFLCTDPTIVVRLLSEGYELPIYDEYGFVLKTGFYFGHDLPTLLQPYFTEKKLGRWLSSQKKTGLMHDKCLYFIKKNAAFDELFFFAHFPPNQTNHSFVLSNLENYQKFIVYFLSRAQTIIKNLPEQRALLNFDNFRAHKKKQKTLTLSLDLPIKSYRFITQGRDVYLTQREFQVLQSYAVGNTIEQVATILGISPRTCREYLENVKNKIGVENRKQLTAACIDSIYHNFKF